MGIKEYIKNNEKTFHDQKDIKYLFCEGKNSDKLVVTFPAFHQEGKPPVYNYINTLKDSTENRLYLLDDFGSRGSFLLGENRNNSIEKSVVSLISYICKKYNIKRENVILNGSSKGGYSALYFGIKYGFGYVISGAPQIKLGDFLLREAPEVADFIVGGHEAEDIKYLNNLLFDLIKYPQSNFPTIFIQVGSGDHHYYENILLFVEELDNKGIDQQLEVVNYFSHLSAAVYYPEYLVKILRYLNNEKCTPAIEKVEIAYENDLLKMNCNAEGENLQFACFIYTNNKCIERIMYQNQKNFEYQIDSNGIYSAKLFARDPENNINSHLTDEIQITDVKDLSSERINNSRCNRDLNRDLDKTVPSEIDIHGSGASVFIFDSDFDVVLGKYLAKQSFISVVSPPFPDKFEIKMLSSWEKRMVEMDLKKEFFKKLSDNSSKFLLIDFVEEGIKLVNYNDTIFSFSDYLVYSSLLDSLDVEFIDRFDIDESFWKNSMDLYIKGLLEIYRENNIIIHETYPNNTYISKNGDIKPFPKEDIKYIEKVNKLLEKYYSYLKEKLPNSNVINIHDKYMASENHIWGLAPVHYEDGYYQEANQIIKGIFILESKTNTNKTDPDFIQGLKDRLKFWSP